MEETLMGRTLCKPLGVVRRLTLFAVLAGLMAIASAPALALSTCESRPCDDGNICTLDTCDPTTFLCTFSTPPDCDDHNVCTTDTCTGPNPGDCAHSTPPNCDDGNLCTSDVCTG